MFNPLDDSLAQKVILLMTGVPGTVAMRDEISRLIKEGDSNEISAYIDNVMGITAPGKIGDVAVQYVLDSGFSINDLPRQKIDQITADSLRQGIDSWTGLFSYAMDKVDNNVGKILGNRAEAADVFTGLVDELDVDVNVNHRLVQEWIDKIDASDESLLEAKSTVKDLIDELTTFPVLVDSSPSDDSTAVAIGQDIVLTFNKKVTAGSGDILIVGSDGDTRTIAVTDSSQVTITGKTLRLNPTEDLHKGTDYSVQLVSGVIMDLVDHAFAGISDATTLNFRTINTIPITVPVTDTTAPTLALSDPLDNATGVVEGQDLVLTFVEAVTGGAGNITIRNSRDPSDILVIPIGDTSQVTFSTNTVTINPTRDLLSDAAYSVQIDNGAIKDLAGNLYAGFIDATTLNFDTADTIAPTLDYDSYNSNYFFYSVSSVDASIYFKFSEIIQAGSGDIIIEGDDGDRQVISVTDSTQVNFSGDFMYLTPTIDLHEDMHYKVSVDNGVITDSAGNAFAGTSYEFSTGFKLTTSDSDIKLGTLGDDVFFAKPNDTLGLDTIQNNDEIDGGAGSDVVFLELGFGGNSDPTISNVEELDIVTRNNPYILDMSRISVFSAISTYSDFGSLTLTNLDTTDIPITLYGYPSNDLTVNLLDSALSGSNTMSFVMNTLTSTLTINNTVTGSLEILNITPASYGGATDLVLTGSALTAVQKLIIQDSSSSADSWLHLSTPSSLSDGRLSVDASVTTRNNLLDLSNLGNHISVFGGSGNEELFGTSFDDTIRGGGGNDWIVGSGAQTALVPNQTDVLTGGAGKDTFVFYDTLAGASAVSSADWTTVITDFTAGVDKIALLTGESTTSVNLNTPQTIASAATPADIIGGMTALGASDTTGALQAAVVTVSGGDAAGTYLYVNDTTAGLSITNDLLIDITGVAGTLTSSDFTFETLLVGTDGADTIVGGDGSDRIIGSGDQSTLIPFQPDVLTGGLGKDTFVFYDTLAGTYTVSNAYYYNLTHITDFAVGTDKIALLTGEPATSIILNTPQTIALAATPADIVGGMTALGASDTAGVLQAAVVTVSGGAAAGTYLYVNDTTVGLSATNDLMINITGVSGTLTSTDFVFA